MGVDELRGVGVIGALFFATLGALGAAALIRPNRLHIDDLGVRSESLLGSKSLIWEEVSLFSAVTLPVRVKAIGYRLKGNDGPAFDGYLPGEFPGGPEAVERLLAERRRAKAKLNGAENTEGP